MKHALNLRAFSMKSQAAATINKWVEEQTQNKIHNLVEPNLLGPNIPMLLVNALYFRGRWRKEFSKSATKKIDFYKTPTEVIQVDAMHQKRTRHGYYENAKLNAKFLRLDFSHDALMVIVLPDQKAGITSLENHIEEVVKTPSFAFEEVNVVLPKFRIESKTDFKKILKQLGVIKAFSLDGTADFSPMAGKKGDISIAEVVQKAFIDVDENGVEAAAATFVLPVLGAAPAPPRIPKDFIVDHPFIFYIKVQDVIIFIGRVLTPAI